MYAGLQKGDRFSVPLCTRVGARDAACGFGFGWAAGLVSVTVWLRFLLRVALVAVTAAETEFPLRSKWFPLHPAPVVLIGSPKSWSPCHRLNRNLIQYPKVIHNLKLC